MSRRPVSEEIKTEKKAERIKFLKSLIFPCILTAIIAAFVYAIITYQAIEEEEEIVTVESYAGDSSEMVLENDYLKFSFDPVTTHFTVTDKKSGNTWLSNPENASNDSLALTEEKGKLNSTMILVYSIDTGAQTTLNNYNYSIENGIYDVEQGDDYIRVNYSIGKVEKEYVIPPVITEDRYNQFMSAMSLDGKNFSEQYFKKYDINKLGKKDDKEELLANFPILETSVIYVLRDSANDNIKKSIQKYFAEAGYTYEDYIADKELDTRAKTSDKPIFTADMIYKLDGDDLVVEVPMSSIDYKEEYPIYTLSILPYFGAGSTEDEGYIVVPEGGGATINFNNGRTSQSSYYANLYGWDYCISRDSVVHNTRAYYNAFGICNNGKSFVCTIDEGSSYASIQADISGKVNSYNYVNAVYSICEREQYDVGDIANSDIYTYVETLPQDESLIQRYSFVDSDDYVDMAKDYAGYLQNKYDGYLTLNDNTSTPVMVEVVGAVDKVKQILGVPVSRPLALTTYTEAADMINNLSAADGIDNLSVKLTGWCNGGVWQQVLNDIDLIHSLGSKKDFKNLISTADNLSVDLYLNGITQYAKESNIFDGFFSFTDAAKLLSRERVLLSDYSAVTYAQRENSNPYYLLHTDEALKMADNLVKYCKENNTGICFEDNGMDLSSDFYKKDTRTRESVLKDQVEIFKALADGNENVMINMGNDYAIAYTDFVTNMDLRGSEYTILDECIPFYQLALHGYVNYAGDSINISGNEEDSLLYAAEYGAALSFALMDESSFSLQKTMYPKYYGAEYDAWHDRMLDIYNRFNSELGHTYNQEMTGHDNLTDTVSLTEYEDGTKVYVNYGYADYKEGNVTVPARDYVVIK